MRKQVQREAEGLAGKQDKEPGCNHKPLTCSAQPAQFQASHQLSLRQSQVNLSKLKKFALHPQSNATWAASETESHIKVMRSWGMWADSVTLGSHQSKPLVSPPQGHNQIYKLTLAFDSPHHVDREGPQTTRSPHSCVPHARPHLAQTFSQKTPTDPVYLVPCPRPH